METRDPFVDDVELVQEFTAKTRTLLFVPRECALDIALGLRPNANASSHRLASDAASAQPKVLQRPDRDFWAKRRISRGYLARDRQGGGRSRTNGQGRGRSGSSLRRPPHLDVAKCDFKSASSMADEEFHERWKRPWPDVLGRDWARP
jgi:hypothetical protein